MKMLIAIVHHDDMNRLCSALLANDIQCTIVAASGGFLKTGSSTLLIGAEEQRIEEILDIFRSNCRKHVSPAHIPENIKRNRSDKAHAENIVSGAIVFITNVEQFIKM